MHWRTKAAVFRALEVVPFSDQMLYWLQRHVTHEWPRPHASLDLLLVAARRIMAAASEHSRGKRFLEVGAGGDLAVAIGLRLLGAEHVTCVDVARLAHLKDIRHAASYLAGNLSRSPPDLRTWGALESFGITYRAPAMLQEAQFHDVDCFYSVDTLEHIPAADLPAVLSAGVAATRSDGCTVHLIDYSDHYARGQELSRFNFLTFDDAQWKPYNTRFQYVNRLRPSEYLRIFERAGLQVKHVESQVVAEQAQVVRNLAPRFAAMERADVFALRGIVVAKTEPRFIEESA